MTALYPKVQPHKKGGHPSATASGSREPLIFSIAIIAQPELSSISIRDNELITHKQSVAPADIVLRAFDGLQE